MAYKELKDLLNKLDSTNVQKLKSILERKVNEIIVNINDDTLSDEELEKLSDFIITREEFREEAREERGLLEGLMIEDFIKAFDEFIKEIQDEIYISEYIELVNSCLRSIGGTARGFRIVRKYAPSKDYDKVKHLNAVKDEFYKELRSYAAKGISEEQLVVFGLIRIIKFELEERLQEHGRLVIGHLTSYRTKKRDITLDEFVNNPRNESVKYKMNEEYGLELQRRVYLWDKLTMDLQDHYYLEKLYEEASEE